MYEYSERTLARRSRRMVSRSSVEDEFEVDSDQVFIGRDKIQPFHLGVLDDFGDFLVVHQQIPGGESVRRLGNSETGSSVTLGIGVDEEYF